VGTVPVTDGRHLGRRISRHDPRTRRFASYLDVGNLPGIPSARDWTHPTHAPKWGMFANSDIGDCTCAAIGHLFQAQAANTGKSITITDRDVLRLYSRPDVGGYDPTRPETDNGAEMLDVLRAMRRDGMAGQRIGAYVAVDALSRTHVEAAISLLGGLYVGLDLPLAWRDATTWDVAPVRGYTSDYKPNSWGGHAATVLHYDRLGLWLVTWGELKFITWEALRTYASEAWAIVNSLWIDDTSMLAPSGFALADLMLDLVEIDRGAGQA